MSIAQTSYGQLQGQVIDDIHVFRGIPFAKPPVGTLRWRAPNRRKLGTAFEKRLNSVPCAIQSTIPGDTGELIGIHTGKTSEDCLYLNIYTPSLD